MTRTLYHVWSELRAYPGRALLSGLSLFIGVLAVVAVTTVAGVTNEVFVATIEQQTGRRVTVQGEVQIPDALVAARSRRLIDLLHGVDQSGGAAALMASTFTRFGDPVHDARDGAPMSGPALTVYLTAGRLDGVRRLPLLQGRWYDPTVDTPLEMVLNIAAARSLGGPGTRRAWLATPVEPPVDVVVVGVIADGASEPAAYVGLLAALAARPTTTFDGGPAVDHVTGLTVLLHHPTATVAELNAVLANAAIGSGASLVAVAVRVDRIDQYQEQLRAQQAAFLAIAVLTLLISALGMMNIGLASVSARTRELIIRRAVGARRVDIVAQLLFAAVAVGLLAAAAAIAAAMAGIYWWVPTRILPETAMTPPAFPWTSAIWGLAAASLTTVAGAILPALVASRLDLAGALRD